MSEQTGDFVRISDLAGEAINELDQTRNELDQRGDEIREIAAQSNARFAEVLRVNSTLKEKTEFLQSLASELSLRNEELEKKNRELEKQKMDNAKLASDLRKNLEKVVLKEKEIELQRDHLERQVEEKTDELIESQKLAIIGELASRMAHDLRNPLSTIKNVIEIMENKQKIRIEEKILYYGKLHRAIDRISHQVDDVLEYGKTTRINLQTCNVSEVLRQLVDDGNFSSGVKINIERCDVKINMDRRKMEAAFTNIIMNAVQAMNEHGTINIRILDNGSNVMIAVEDSGPGILDEHISKIFEPLFTTKQTGTGLGLSICRKIIEQHGGSITVKNRPTTFIILLPNNF